MSVLASLWDPFGSILAPFWSILAPFFGRFWGRCLIVRALFAHLWDRSLFLFILSFFPSFLHSCIDFSYILSYILPFTPGSFSPFFPPSLHPFIHSSLHPFIHWPLHPLMSPSLNLASILPFIPPSLFPFIAWRIQSWPGGLREAIK